MTRRNYGSYSGARYNPYGQSRYQRQQALFRPANPYIDKFRGVLLRLKDQLDSEWQPETGDAGVRDTYLLVIKDALSATLFLNSNSQDYGGVPDSIDGLRARFAADWLSPIIASEINKAQRVSTPAIQAMAAFDAEHRAGLITWLQERLEREIVKLPPLSTPGTPGQSGGAAR